MIDIQKARLETPACKNIIHFNNAGASLQPECVSQAVINHLTLENTIGGYEAEAAAESAIASVYRSLARLIHAKPEDIAVMSSATTAWDMAFYGFPFQAGDKILTTTSEYASNVIAYMHVAQKYGVTIDVIPDDEHGQISLKKLKNRIDKHVKIISINHIPTNGGLVNPAEEVGKIAKDAGVFYFLDACQSVGQMSLDVEKLHCHVLTATGRKYLRGPRGTGFLYVREDIREKLSPPFLDLHSARWTSKNHYILRSDARRFETWESNVAAKIGLGVAADYAHSWGVEHIQKRVQALGHSLRSKLSALPHITVHDKGQTKCGIVTFSHATQSAQEVQAFLHTHSINTSISLAEYARFDMDDRGLREIVRASVHYYNTEEEIDTFCRALEKIITLG